MIKRTLAIATIMGGYCAQAQDISTITNTVDIYTKGVEVNTAKYSAMAGAMGALGGDISAATVNPAGAGVYITGDFAGTLQFNNYTNTSSVSNSSLKYKNKLSNLSQIGGIASFSFGGGKWKFVNIGLNYINQNIDNYVQTPATGTHIKADLIDANNKPVVGTFSHRGHAYNRSGDITKTTFVVGANYDNQVYVGAGLNFNDVMIEQYDTQKFSLDVDNHSIYNFNKRFTPFSEHSKGFSLSAGIIAKIDKNFRIGASLESPTWWSMERLFTGQDLDKSGGVIVDTYNEERSFSTPMKATISGAFVANKHFAFNIDYTLGLTKPNYNVQGDAEVELNNFFKSEEYKNLSELKLGGEFRYQGLRARAGYAYSANSFKENALIGSRNTFATGLGYDFKSLYIDATYQYITSNYNNYFGKGNYFTNDISIFQNDHSISNVTNKRNNFLITLGYRF